MQFSINVLLYGNKPDSLSSLNLLHKYVATGNNDNKIASLQEDFHELTVRNILLANYITRRPFLSSHYKGYCMLAAAVQVPNALIIWPVQV